MEKKMDNRCGKRRQCCILEDWVQINEEMVEEIVDKMSSVGEIYVVSVNQIESAFDKIKRV